MSKGRASALVPPDTSFSHQARAKELGLGCGSFFFQVSMKAASVEALESGPTVSLAETELLPGRQSSAHSSHDTLAFSWREPAGASGAMERGTIRTTSL